MVLPLSRLHDVRGERSNVPRDNAALFGAGIFGKVKWTVFRKAKCTRREASAGGAACKAARPACGAKGSLGQRPNVPEAGKM